MEKELTAVFIEQALFRLFEESLPRLLSCVDEVSDEQLWYRPNDNSNSIGNLVLHLTGNVNQWINTGLGGDQDNRDRQSEFDERGSSKPRKVMIEELSMVMDRAREVLTELSSDELLSIHTVQGYKESGISIVMHVVEHFSYHVGQATYIVKSVKNIDTAYYSGEDLDITE